MSLVKFDSSLFTTNYACSKCGQCSNKRVEYVPAWEVGSVDSHEPENLNIFCGVCGFLEHKMECYS